MRRRTIRDKDQGQFLNSLRSSKTLGVGTPTGLMTGVVFDLANPVSPCILISGDRD